MLELLLQAIAIHSPLPVAYDDDTDHLVGYPMRSVMIHLSYQDGLMIYTSSNLSLAASQQGSLLTDFLFSLAKRI
jgi:hypothetical protein